MSLPTPATQPLNRSRKTHVSKYNVYKTPEFIDTDDDSDDENHSATNVAGGSRHLVQNVPLNLVKSNKTYTRQPKKSMPFKNRLPSRPDPLENLPSDLNINFSKWFYGDLNEFKHKTKTNLRPVVERIMGEINNPKLDPTELKFSTYDLIQPSDLSEIKQIMRYKISLEEQVQEENLTAGSVYIRTHRKRSKNATNPAELKKLSLIVEPEIVIVDRRPMLKKLTKQAASRQTTSLIEPSEDCDDSDVELVFVEIDCDT